MKQTKFSRKLRITKETVADLNSKEMNDAHAGNVGDTIPEITHTCRTWCPITGVPCKIC
jgi:hypothetical protein